MTKKTLELPNRRGWPVFVDGDTLDALKRIQASQIGTPSYASLIREAVLDLEKKAGKK